MQVQWVLAVVTMAGLAGCLSSDGGTAAERLDFPYYDANDGRYHFLLEPEGRAVHFDWAPGAVGKIRNDGAVPFDVELPPMFLHVSGADGMGGVFGLHEGPMTVAPGETVWHLAPPSAWTVELTVDGDTFMVDATASNDFAVGHKQILSGENWYDLEAYQHHNFPHRTPGQDNYALAIEYFAQFFADLGYEVEVDPFGTTDLTDAAGCSPVGLNSLCPESLANVVATKPGTDPDAGILFVAGGHFDMVPGTTHAAFDDTSGTIATMELARAMAPFEFRHTLMFGLWGGEENGILGSQFWVQTHPIERTQIRSYWNLDVVGMTWPSPIPKPDPYVIAAGIDVPTIPADGTPADPATQDLLGWAQHLQQDWFAFPETAAAADGSQIDLWLYEGIAAGQLAGYAGVNAQSDHTPFAAAGIPSYFIFNGDALAGDNPIGIHNERDTLWNMTKYAYWAEDAPLDEPLASLDPAAVAAGKDALVRSIENTMWFPFYHAVLVDLGVYDPPLPVVGPGGAGAPMGL